MPKPAGVASPRDDESSAQDDASIGRSPKRFSLESSATTQSPQKLSVEIGPDGVKASRRSSVLDELARLHAQARACRRASNDEVADLDLMVSEPSVAADSVPRSSMFGQRPSVRNGSKQRHMRNSHEVEPPASMLGVKSTATVERQVRVSKGGLLGKTKSFADDVLGRMMEPTESEEDGDAGRESQYQGKSRRSVYQPRKQPWEKYVHSTPVRKYMARIVLTSGFDVFMGLIILFNFSLIWLDTDIRASGGETPSWIDVMMSVCFWTYVLELSARAYVERCKVFNSNWNNLDFLIVGVGFIDEVVPTSYKVNFASVGALKVIRVARLVRLVRAARTLQSISELRRLLQMMVSCFKTLFWSFLMTFFVMSLFAIIAVELVNDVVKLRDEENYWGECHRCANSYSSVMAANLTFFQTIIAGDSWGYISIPVIEREPMTAFIFVGAHLTIIFGVLNLVVAVVVDTYAEKRAYDADTVAADKEREEEQERRHLHKIFEMIDVDGGGTLSLDELQEGAETVLEFRNKLRAMDIKDDDLQQLFTILDEDGSGEVDPEEFVEALYRFKTTESKTATVFVKHFVKDLQKRTATVEKRLDTLAAIQEKVERFEAHAKDQKDHAKRSAQAATSVEQTILQSNNLLSGLESSLNSHGASMERNVQAALEKAFQDAMSTALESAVDSVMSKVGHSGDPAVASIANRMWPRSHPRSPGNQASSSAGERVNVEVDLTLPRSKSGTGEQRSASKGSPLPGPVRQRSRAEGAFMIPTVGFCDGPASCVSREVIDDRAARALASGRRRPPR